MAATMLRRRIRRPREGAGAGLAAGAAYLGTIVYGWVFFAGVFVPEVLDSGPGPVGTALFAILAMTLVTCPVITTFSLHVAWPMSLWFVVCLRKVDPRNRWTAGRQRSRVVRIEHLCSCTRVVGRKCRPNRLHRIDVINRGGRIVHGEPE